MDRALLLLCFCGAAVLSALGCTATKQAGDRERGEDQDDRITDGIPGARAGASVSGACSAELRQGGIDKVDLLFMIDNSDSMAEEQRKLAAVLPNLVAALATGNRNGQPKPPGMKSDFAGVQSLHIGVVSSDMGINGAPAINSCGDRSFVTPERDTTMSNQRVNKPVGDDGILQVDTVVAVDGIWGPDRNTRLVTNFVPGDPTCQGVAFPANTRYIDFTSGGDAAAAAHRFSCVAKRGRNGCGLEQQLESALKSLTPPDSKIKFTAASPNGHGTPTNTGSPPGKNHGFLRADSILALVIVSDEPDCSSPDASRALFDSTSMQVTGGLDVRCGLSENQRLLFPISRYIDGLAALRPAPYKDRLVFAALVGIPLASNTGATVHSGTSALDRILARADMQFTVRRSTAGTDDQPVPTCISESGDGSAAPGRRYLEVAKAFGDSGIVSSICADEYQSLFQVLVDKIAAQLEGNCLPIRLNPDAEGRVPCEVVEIHEPNSDAGCSSARGRSSLPERRVGGTVRTVCSVEQVPGGKGVGWYYDNSSNELMDQCRKHPQRIAFTVGAEPLPGAILNLECPDGADVCTGGSR